MIEGIEKIQLEVDINHYKQKIALRVYMDDDEEREQRRRLWKLKILNNKEDDEFLKRMGLKRYVSPKLKEGEKNGKTK